MSFEFKFQELLKEPLGPFKEDQLFDPFFPPPGFLPNLELVILECAGQNIGLDESEYILPPPETSRIAKNPVYFYGVLKVDSLSWLSEEGKKLLEDGLKRRDEQLHPGIRESQLTLRALYGDTSDRGSRISIILQCEKNMLVEYMTSDKYSKDFIIRSKSSDDKNYRMYSVISLDATTSSQSQNFLMRYRLWGLIKKLVDIDGGATPVHERTVSWLVARFLDRMRANDPEFHTGLSWAMEEESESSDAEGEGDVGMGQEDNGERASHRRHLRHISQAEVKGCFATQCEWLLAHQLAPKHRNFWIINTMKWVRFCEHVQVARKRALQGGGQWGLPYGVREVRDESLAVRLSKFGESVQFWKNKLKNLELKWPEFTRRQEKESEAPSENEDLGGPPIPAQPPARKYHYDSDFSEPSTPGEPDSEEEFPPPPAEILARVPFYCWMPPTILGGHFRWNCPGCDHSIDFLSLRKEDLDLLPSDLAKYISSDRWGSMKEDRVIDAFGIMANSHLKWHMNQVGVDLVQKREKWYVVPYQTLQKAE